MERILTLLLVFLISLAPAAPGEAGAGHSHATAPAGVIDEAADVHGTDPTADALAVECSLTGGHCVVALVTPIRDFFEVGLDVATGSAVYDAGSGEGIALTSEPPPPRA